jgi:hypothetical protein
VLPDEPAEDAAAQRARRKLGAVPSFRGSAYPPRSGSYRAPAIGTTFSLAGAAQNHIHEIINLRRFSKRWPRR